MLDDGDLELDAAIVEVADTLLAVSVVEDCVNQYGLSMTSYLNQCFVLLHVTINVKY